MNKLSLKFGKRLLALILCGALVLPMFPQIVRAENATDTYTNVGTLVADGVVAAGSLAPDSDALGSGKISLVPVTGNERMIQDAVYAFVSNDNRYVMSHNASASATGTDTSVGSISLDAAATSDGKVTVDPEDRDSALWIMHQHRYVPYTTKAQSYPANELPSGSRLFAGYRSPYYTEGPTADTDYQIALKFGTSAVAFDEVFFGIFPRKGVSGTDGSYWLSDSTAPNRFLNWGDFVINSTTADWTLPADDMLQDAEQVDWYTCWNTAMVRLADGSYICFRYRNSRHSNNRPDLLILCCDDSGTWKVQRYFTASNGSTPSGAKPITDLFELNSDGTLNTVKPDELEKLKIRLYQYEINAAAVGYSTYYGESEAAVIDAIQEKTTVYDVETAEPIAFTDTATLGCCYVDTNTWNVKYVHDDGTQEILAKLTVHIGALRVRSGLSSQGAVTSKNSSFASTVYVPNVGETGVYVSSTDEPVTFTADFGTQQVEVGVKASMLYDAKGQHIDTAVPNSKGADYTVKFGNTQVGTLKVYVADTTIAQQMPNYPAAGSVVVHKDKTTGQEAFALNGVGSIQLSAAGKPATNGVDLIVMVDLSSSMRYSLAGDTAMYGTPYYSSDGKLNPKWTDAGWQATRMYAMEESLKEMVTNLQGSGVDVDIAIADFGDLDHYDFNGASLLNNSAYPQIDAVKDDVWNSVWKGSTKAAWYELANHLNYVLGSNDNGLFNYGDYPDGTDSQCRPFNIHEWKYSTDLSDVNASMLGKQPSKIHTGDQATLKGAFADVETLNMTDVITSLRISNSKMLGTNYDLGLECMYKIAYERKQTNIANGEDREIICIFMSDGAAMQYNYFSGSAHSNAWNDFLAGNTDSFAQSRYSWSLEKNQDGTLAHFDDFHPVIRNLLEAYHKVLKAGKLKYGTGAGSYNPCKCADSELSGESALKCMEESWREYWPHYTFVDYTWRDIMELHTLNMENDDIRGALWWGIEFVEPGLKDENTGRFVKYYVDDKNQNSAMQKWGITLTHGEALRLELVRVLMKTQDGSYSTYSPFSYFYNKEGKNWWAEAIKGDTGKLYPVINKFAKGKTHVEKDSNPSTYNGDVVNNFSGETTQGLALSGQDYISGFRGLGLDIYSIGFALGTKGDNCITASTMNGVLSKISSGTNNTDGTNKYFFLANDQEALDNALNSIVDNVAEGASRMWFTDTMGEDFDLLTGNTLKDREGKDIVLDFVPTVSVNLYHADINGKPTTLIRTLEKIEFTGTKTAKSTVYNDDGTATTTSDVWDDTTDMISGSKVYYNAGTATYNLKLDDSGLTYPLAPETFFWTIGNLPDTVISLEYQIYLTGSMEGKYDDYGITTIHDTNESAVLHYRDVQGNDVTQEPVSPTYSWDPLPGSLIVDKTVAAVEEKTDAFTLTLDAYATGRFNTEPADIVLVLDQSSSMYTPLGWTRDRINLTGGDSFTSVNSALSSYAISDFTTQAAVAGDVQENAKRLGYYIAVHNSHNYMYLVQYAQDSLGRWGWYYVSIDQTVRSIDALNYDTVNESSTYNSTTGYTTTVYIPEYNNLTAAQAINPSVSFTRGLLTNVTYYKTQYGALVESVESFVAGLQESGVNHRVGIVGFASPFYDGWNHYNGSGLYVDGNFYLYDTDFMYKGWKNDDGTYHFENGGFVEENWAGATSTNTVILDPNTTFLDTPIIKPLDSKVLQDAYSNSIILKDANGNPTGGTMYGQALADVSTADGYSSILNSIGAINANYQQTCPSVGIEMAEEIFAARTEGTNRDKIVVLFSDGVPTVRLYSNRHHGYSDDIFAKSLYWTISGGVEDSLDRAQEAKANGVKIYTVGTAAMQASLVGGTNINSGNFLDYLSSNYAGVTYGQPDASMISTGKIEWVKNFQMNTDTGEGTSGDPDQTNPEQSNKARYYSYYNGYGYEEWTYYYRVAGEGSSGGDYALFASADQTSVGSDLNVAFDTVMESITVPATVLRDVLSDYFVLSSDQVADIKVYTADYLGKDVNGQDTFSDDWVLLDTVTVELTNSGSDDRLDTISVSGFDYRENYVGKTEKGELHGKKLIVQVAIKGREGFWGGNNVPTNKNDAGIYGEGNDLLSKFPEPQVNVPVKPVITGKNPTVYYGEDELDALDDLVDKITIGTTVSDSGEEVGIEVTYDRENDKFIPKEDWMDDFVDLSWDPDLLNPADPNTTVSGKEPADYTFGVVLTPKTDGNSNDNGTGSNIAGNPVDPDNGIASDEATSSVNILVPVIKFEDSTIDLGDVTNNTYYETNNRKDNIQWVNKEDPYGKDGLPTTPTPGFDKEPDITLTYTPVTDEQGYFTKDTPVNVEVYLGKNATESNKMTHEVYFDWAGCDNDDLHDGYETVADDEKGDTLHRHKGDVSSNEFYVHVTYLLNADTVVIEFGLKVDIDVLKNDKLPDGTLINSIAFADRAPGIFTNGIASGYAASKDGNHGVMAVVTEDGKSLLRYTPSNMEMNVKEVFIYAVANGTGADARFYYTPVTVIPASVIYYEDNFLDYSIWESDGNGKYNPTYGDNTWNTAGTAQDDTQAEDRPGQALDSLDANNIYGYDAAYTDMATYSNGAAKWVTVKDGIYAEATFRYWGTGFDIISLTDSNSGTILITVEDLVSGTTEYYMVDTYYGYKYVDGEWVVDSGDSDTLYQVPVMKVDMKAYSHYQVNINVSWASWLDHGQNDGNGSYNFYLDAIRIYNPAQQTEDGSISDSVINGAYNADHEANPTYTELRNMLIQANTFNALGEAEKLAGVIFIDGNKTLSGGENGSYESVQNPGKTFAVSEYTNYGPNNELYLAPNQAVSFTLGQVSANGRVHLALKSVGNFGGDEGKQDGVENNDGIGDNGGSVTVEIYGINADGTKKSIFENDQMTIRTATDLYYDITALAGTTVVIRNKSNAGIVSVTNIKTTDTPSVMMFSVSRSSVAQALAILNEGDKAPMEPTEGSIHMSYATLSFEDLIVMNAYFTVEGIEVDPSDLGMIIFSSDATDGTVDNAEAVIHGGISANGRYCVSTEGIAAKNLGDTIYFRIYARLADGSYVYGSAVSYSPRTYANTVLNGNYSAKMKALVVAMLNYGAAAQLHFGYHTDNLANADLEAPDYSNVIIDGYKAASGQGTELAKLHSASLILKSKTTLRMFFKIDSSVRNFTATCNGQALEVKQRGNLVYVDVVGIAAKDLDEYVTVTVSDGTNVTDIVLNPMSYCQGVQNDTTGAFGQDMKDLVAALYLYNQAANAYFDQA